MISQYCTNEDSCLSNHLIRRIEQVVIFVILVPINVNSTPSDNESVTKPPGHHMFLNHRDLFRITIALKSWKYKQPIWIISSTQRFSQFAVLQFSVFNLLGWNNLKLLWTNKLTIIKFLQSPWHWVCLMSFERWI